MLTIDEILAIPLFSGLAASELERLAQTSKDVHLGPGEFAVNEGGERALFAVLAGKFEVVKLVDGFERRLGWRLPGTIFGEVPIALGTPFPGYRAGTRAPRIEPGNTRHRRGLARGLNQQGEARPRERIGTPRPPRPSRV
jgi:thioredoxin reductase (NADPH)